MAPTRTAGRWARAPARERATPEQVILTTTSGQTLAVEVREPKGRARGTVILLHALMGSRKTFDRPAGNGLAVTLVRQGLRTLALDFRGHGESGPLASRGASGCFDDLVTDDLPALCAAALERWPRDRLTVVGHSLGGYAALAAAGTRTIEVDGIATIASNVWLPSHEPHLLARTKKRAIVEGVAGITRVCGHFPARALRIGSDDETAPMMNGWVDWWRNDAWTSQDGRIDYASAMAGVKGSLCFVASQGDKLACPPENARRFASLIDRGRVSVEVVTSGDGGGPPPGHMELVTTRIAASVWNRIAHFAAEG
jgi:predicted alpha/beta hydrolase